MKKVDETIDALCDHIQELLKDESKMCITNTGEMIKALAELISARAQHN